MDNNQAFAYNLEEIYSAVYVNLNGFDQIIFYWDLKNNCEKRKPKWRTTKEVIEEGMKIVSYTNFGFVLEINGRLAKYDWYEYDRDIARLKGPNHKAKLINFGEWEKIDDPDFYRNSPTANGQHYNETRIYNNSGHYDKPLEEDYDI